jgi:hypothetical protein
MAQEGTSSALFDFELFVPFVANPLSFYPCKLSDILNQNRTRAVSFYLFAMRKKVATECTECTGGDFFCPV